MVVSTKYTVCLLVGKHRNRSHLEGLGILQGSPFVFYCTVVKNKQPAEANSTEYSWN